MMVIGAVGCSRASGKLNAFLREMRMRESAEERKRVRVILRGGGDTELENCLNDGTRICRVYGHHALNLRWNAREIVVCAAFYGN